MDTQKAIRELDKALSAVGLSYILYTCGGTQLIFLGYNTRKTQDVDLIIEEIDEPLKLAAQEVAKKLDLETDWLNNKVFPLGKRLGRGWKKKAVILFEGKALTLMGLVAKISSTQNFMLQLIVAEKTMMTYFFSNQILKKLNLPKPTFFK